MTQAWESVRLEQVLIERRETPKAQDLISGAVQVVSKISFSDGLIQMRQSSDTKTGMILAYPGDILVSGINASKGAIAIYDPNASSPIAATIHYGAYTPIESRVDRKFLWWLLRSKTFNDLLQQYVPGGIKTELKAKRFLPIPIPLPPLEEQKRIVAIVENLAAQIAEARGLREKADVHTEFAWETLARKKLNSLKTSRIEPLGNLVTIRGGGTPSKSDPTFWNGDIPWVSPKDMKVRDLYDAQDHITLDAVKNSSAKLIDTGAVLVVVRGMILAHTVPSAVLRCSAAINQDIKALIPNHNLNPEYLLSWLWAFNPDLLALVEKSTHDTRKLETEKLLSFPIAIPELEIQHKIVAELNSLKSQVSSLEKLQEATRLELNALLPSVLSKAFAGEL
jgi:type I restriction enzyme, S subunit